MNNKYTIEVGQKIKQAINPPFQKEFEESINNLSSLTKVRILIVSMAKEEDSLKRLQTAKTILNLLEE
jgi:hypothetical protein